MRRDQPDIGALLDSAMAALEQANQPRFGDLFHCLRFSGDAVLGHGVQRNARLRNFLSFLCYLEVRANMAAYPTLFMFLIERFALEDDGTPETPHQIARLMYHLAKPCPGEHIADPVCGSASLLLGATRWCAIIFIRARRNARPVGHCRDEFADARTDCRHH